MTNTRGNVLRGAFTVLAALAVVIGTTAALAAEKRTVRWVQSIYIDGKGDGLKHPEGVACRDDHFVVADTGNSRILRYSYQGDSVTQEAEFLLPKSYPIKIELDSKGDIYFLDGRERRIAMMSAAGEERGFLKPKSLPSSKDVVPKSFAIGANDDIYVLDIFSARVLVLDSEGQYRRHVDFPDEYGFFSDVEVDAQGNIYLLDGADVVVYKALNGADRFTRLTDDIGSYLNFPTNLALDDRGVLYLVDQYGSGLALVGGDGTFLGRFIEMGWDENRLYYPSQICISSNGNLFIADRNNSRVQRFRLNQGASAERKDEAAPVE
jgi:sugar lactone lactonase YvrE